MIGKMFNCSEESEWEEPFWTNLLNTIVGSADLYADL